MMAMSVQQDYSRSTTDLRHDSGRWLKGLRESAGLSQRELSNILGLEYYTFISQLENGRGRIPPNRYHDFAAALQVDVREFVKNLLMYYEPVAYHILFERDVEAVS